MAPIPKWDLFQLLRTAGMDVPSHLADHPVTGVSDNSQRIEPGYIFVATRGTHTDSHLFISDAISRGATTVIVEQETPPYDTAQILQVQDSRDCLGRLAHAWHGSPTSDMRIVAVTGTNGKTTTVQMVETILNACLGPCGVIGTIEHRLGDWKEAAINTTPGSPKLASLSAQIKSLGGQALAMEASSHAMDQRRISGVEIDVALLTNLTQDHLDYHGSMEAYADAKAQLFLDYLQRPKAPGKPEPTAILFQDDEYCREITARIPPSIRTIRLSTVSPLDHPERDVTATDIQQVGGCLSFRAHARGRKDFPAFDLKVQLPIPGRYNAQNALGALVAAIALGIEPEKAAVALATMAPVPGRLQPVRLGQKFEVLVDYAHTPDALENSLQNAREICQPGGRLIVMFGCGGDRDATKRPIMGSIAIAQADMVIVTDDNPRTEPSGAIIQQILEGIRTVDPAGLRHASIPDRGAAIRSAIMLANPGDVVLLAGKGHETYQEVHGRRTHFDDVEEATTALGGNPWSKTPTP